MKGKSESLLPSLSFLFIPVGISVAILRSQLWDIDALINRTLVYGTLAILLALVYVGLVIGLGSLVRLFTGQLAQSPVVIVASTLAIAALFQPLRHRIQAIIYRRFYRRKYDTAKTIAAFSQQLTDAKGLADFFQSEPDSQSLRPLWPGARAASPRKRFIIFCGTCASRMFHKI